jgi:hypothetical protein
MSGKAISGKATSGKATSVGAISGKATSARVTNGKATNGRATNGNRDLDVLGKALRVALNAASQGTQEDPYPEGGARELEILFYGMMCFDPLPGGRGFRVLFPNGMDLPELTEIPAHTAGLWVRARNAKATARWSGPSLRNDFFLNGSRQLTITGLTKTELDTTAFDGRVTNLQDCDSEFAIGDDPDAVIDMIVDRGTLSAHVANDAGLIVIRWAVQAEADVPVRFAFGSDFVEIPPTVQQVILANVSADAQSENFRDFQLYRKLAAYPQRTLTYQPPQQMPPDGIELQEPTFGYTSAGSTPASGRPVSETRPDGLQPIVGVVSAAAREVLAQTPNIVCSGVVSRIPDAA